MLLTEPGKLGKVLDVEAGLCREDVGKGFAGRGPRVGKGMAE